MNYLKISIVTPSFNQAAYLEQTILSVLDQNYPNLEYIIIDGGSTDGSLEIIKKYEKRLAYWVSEKDDGLYHAIQKGFERSSGEIMAWLNSDDLYHKSSLFAVSDIFSSKPEISWLMGKNSWYTEEGSVFEMSYNKMNESWSKWKFYTEDEVFIQQESIFWRTSLWKTAGASLNINYKLAADFELWSRFFEFEKLFTCNFYLSGFRIRSKDQKSFEQIDLYKQEMNQILKPVKQTRQTKNYLIYIRFVKRLIGLVPVEKWKNKMMTKILKLPPVLMYIPREGSRYIKVYNLK